MNPLDEAYRKVKGWKDRLIARVLIHEAYESTFSTPAGKEVLRHLCKVGFIYKTTFVAGDPHLTAMNEGKRAFALSILRFVNKDHAELLKQVEEAIQRDESE